MEERKVCDEGGKRRKGERERDRKRGRGEKGGRK